MPTSAWPNLKSKDCSQVDNMKKKKIESLEEREKYKLGSNHDGFHMRKHIAFLFELFSSNHHFDTDSPNKN